ncbi:hypothetical protein U1Q18_026627 [Sarracenia purpurea var. burkii]
MHQLAYILNKFLTSMEDPYVLLRHKLFLLLLITVLSSTWNGGGTTAAAAATTATAANTKPLRVVTKLIHRHSIFSPYYNPTATISQRVWQEINGSMARYSHLKAMANPNTKVPSTAGDVHISLLPDNHGSTFLVNFSIGEPPVPQLAVMDTGSTVLWIQCSTCNECFDQISTKFDPSKSSTYRDLPCNSPFCAFDFNSCDSKRTCTYSNKYADNTSTSGTFGMEELRFTTPDDGTVRVSDVVFGCGQENRGLRVPMTGILGLGPHKVSLVSHMGSKFSYCIGNTDDHHYEYNQLIIGDGARIDGYSTPLQFDKGLYFVTLEGISVGEKKLDVDPKIFKRGTWGEGGVVIDSGSTLTFLHRGGYDPLKEEVMSLMDGVLQKVTVRKWTESLCYKGVVSRDVKGFPAVTFHFAGAADLVLDEKAMFLQVRKGAFCMAVQSTRFGEPALIGIRAQQYYNVGYDLNAMKLYLQRIDCELLED